MTVAVVTYDSARVLPALLSSLDAGMAGVASWGLVVADNASSDGSADLAERLRPDALVVRTGRNGGYAAGVNAAAAAAPDDGDLLVLNPDVRLRPGCGAALAAALDRGRTGIAAPRLVDPDGRTWESLRRDPSVRRAWSEALLGGTRSTGLGLGETVGAGEAYEHPHPVDWATGAVLAVSHRCRQVLGPWDESFFLYSEEVEYCQRARAAGFEVGYVPDAVAEHDSGPYGQDPRLWGMVVRNRVALYSRQHGPLRSAAFRAGVATGEALRAPRRRAARVGLRQALARGPAGIPAPGHRPRTAAPLPPPAPADARPVVWFAAQDWWYHNQAHSDFQLMRAVARHRPVLVVNSLGLRVPSAASGSTRPWRRIWRKVRSTAKLVRRPVPGLPGFHVMSPLLLPFYGDTALARLNARSVRAQVSLATAVLRLRGTPDIGATIPTAWPVVRGMARASLVYNRSDVHSEFPEADGPWVASLERSLLEGADRVAYVSRALMARDAPVVGARAEFLDHGVDLEHFDPEGPEHPELADVPHPRIGFFGGLDDYVVDMSLLEHVARELPDCTLVLVGDATCPMDALTSLPNVRWFGFRPYAEIPAFGRGFDVALMPWLDNEWIRFANPIKMKEYLALGLPVVSTDFPEVRHYRDTVAVADSPDAFVDLVREALREPGRRAARRASVLPYSWEGRAAALFPPPVPVPTGREA